MSHANARSLVIRLLGRSSIFSRLACAQVMTVLRAKLMTKLMAMCLLTLFIAGCATATAPQTSLYSQLGGNKGVSAIVDGLLNRISTDERIVHHFQATDIALFRQSLIDHLCQVTDGGCTYAGETMANSHQGLGITEADFDVLVGHLIESMKAQGIPTGTRNALLKRLAPMYSDITYH